MENQKPDPAITEIIAQYRQVLDLALVNSLERLGLKVEPNTLKRVTWMVLNAGLGTDTLARGRIILDHNSPNEKELFSYEVTGALTGDPPTYFVKVETSKPE